MPELPEEFYCKLQTILLLQPSSADGCRPWFAPSAPRDPKALTFLCLPGGSSALAAVSLGTMPAQCSWPSATCSHLTLFVLAQLLFPKAPPEATWKMRSVNWSALKINQEKTPKHFARWLRSSCFSALGTPGRQVEGLELALLQGNGTWHPIQLLLDGGLRGVLWGWAPTPSWAAEHLTEGLYLRRLRYPRYLFP